MFIQNASLLNDMFAFVSVLYTYACNCQMIFGRIDVIKHFIYDKTDIYFITSLMTVASTLHTTF